MLLRAIKTGARCKGGFGITWRVLLSELPSPTPTGGCQGPQCCGGPLYRATSSYAIQVSSLALEALLLLSGP